MIDRRGAPVATLEPYLEGEYRKYSNNDGVTLNNRNTPQAFSHFTYENSDHKLVIVDIQGVNDSYTDPQIHTHDHKGFGLGNLGAQGIAKFLITHECNAVCKYLNLAPVQNKYSSSENLALRLVKGKTITISKSNHQGTMPFPSDLKLDFSKSIKILDESEPFTIDPSSFKCAQTIKCESMNAIIVTSDYLIGSSDSSIKVWDLNTFELKATLQGHSGSIETVTANEKYIFSGSTDKVSTLLPSVQSHLFQFFFSHTQKC